MKILLFPFKQPITISLLYKKTIKLYIIACKMSSFIDNYLSGAGDIRYREASADTAGGSVAGGLKGLV
jgi:hypothetical protein